SACNCGRRRARPSRSNRLASRRQWACKTKPPSRCRTDSVRGRKNRLRVGVEPYTRNMSLIVKICGLSTPETLDAALNAGADMVGFVFFPPSPRHLQFDVARGLGQRVCGRAQKVALTVDADEEFTAAVVEALRPDMLQLHGAESVAQIATIRRRF